EWHGLKGRFAFRPVWLFPVRPRSVPSMFAGESAGQKILVSFRAVTKHAIVSFPTCLFLAILARASNKNQDRGAARTVPCQYAVRWHPRRWPIPCHHSCPWTGAPFPRRQ